MTTGFYSGTVIAAILLLLVSSKADFIEDFVGRHNQYRELHQVEPLVLIESYTQDCKKYAEELAAANKLEHSDYKGKYGENLCFTPRNPLNCVNKWYDEIKDYNFKKPSYSKATEHFTQLIWKNSRIIGVGKAENSNGHYVVARYYPAGNLAGEFVYNVLDSSAFRSSNLSKISKLLIWLLPALLLQDFMQK